MCMFVCLFIYTYRGIQYIYISFAREYVGEIPAEELEKYHSTGNIVKEKDTLTVAENNASC